MSWPLRATIPSRVIRRRLVIVYVEVSQARNGRTTHHRTTTSATIHTTRLTRPLSTNRSRKIAGARVITRTRPGTIIAFGWVRVSTMTDSPSVSSFGEMPTGESLSLSGANVHHIARRDDRSSVGALDHEAPVLVDLAGSPLEQRPLREVDAHVAVQGLGQTSVVVHERV